MTRKWKCTLLGASNMADLWWKWSPVAYKRRFLLEKVYNNTVIPKIPDVMASDIGIRRYLVLDYVSD